MSDDLRQSYYRTKISGNVVSVPRRVEKPTRNQAPERDEHEEAKEDEKVDEDEEEEEEEEEEERGPTVKSLRESTPLRGRLVEWLWL